MLKTANNAYFAYEFCNGGTLEQLIAIRGYFSEVDALEIFA